MTDMQISRPTTDLAERAATLLDLHRPGDPLVLVNAWDVASATTVVAAGARAVGTSSAAMAAVLGIPDAPEAPLDTIFAAIARITHAVDVPVTADLFDGYGLPAGELVDRLLEAGAVGCNLEDSDHARGSGLLDPGVVGARLHAVRDAATRAGVPVVLNARIDCLLHTDDRAAALAEIVDRARRYLDAGADCVFPVRLADPDDVRTVVGAVGAAVNASWTPAVALPALAAAGARRVSMGPQAHARTLATLDQFARPLLAPAG
ncbi:MAG TPA: isocitrate lyase/phosphoenolpyruvate mutase family protein [Acidimicrobiia bacterium]|nr:isocitrate lyase/phosphoenolpyruvate mutase family protein [Acidimicrobiia bacterium]